MCSLFDFIRRRHDYKLGFFVQMNILEGRAGYVVLMGRISVAISYSSRCLTTETIKYTNENSFIENLAASNTVCGTERQTNVIINNKCTFCMFRRRAALSWKCKRFVSVNCSVQRKRSNRNLEFLYSFFMCLIDMNKFFENIYDLWNTSTLHVLCLC